MYGFMAKLRLENSGPGDATSRVHGRVKLQEEKMERRAEELAQVMPDCEGYLEPKVR